MAKHAAKVLIIGEGAVGKTSLLRRYVEGIFHEDYVATIGVNIKNKLLPDFDLELSLWDIYGQKSISPGKHSSNYIGAEGAALVFDLTRKNTFDTLDFWLEGLYSITGKIPVVVLGNKNDIIEDFENNCDTVFTSASKDEFHDYMVSEHYYRSVYSSEPSFVPVPYIEFKRWAKGHNKFQIRYNRFLTSAKTGKNVESAFHVLGKKIMRNKIRFK